MNRIQQLVPGYSSHHNVIVGARVMIRPDTAHPGPQRMPVGWTCSECEIGGLARAVICPECYAALCPECAARDEHRMPAGERAGKPCVPVANAA
jgi:hypothetical protein